MFSVRIVFIEDIGIKFKKGLLGLIVLILLKIGLSMVW